MGKAKSTKMLPEYSSVIKAFWSQVDMRILLLMVPISLVLLGAAIWAFVWAVRRGQFDDLDTPALDILVDDDQPRPRQSPSTSAPISTGETRAD